jgi:signal transduction histidine kinase
MKDLGHEFRTPIMSLQGYTEGLEDGVFKPDEGYFKLMAGELSHLTMLTHAIESMQLEPVSPSDATVQSDTPLVNFLQEAINRWSTRFAQRSLQLDIIASEKYNNYRISLSPVVFKQIADNLLSNMFRYATSGNRCTVELSDSFEKNRIKLEFTNEASDVTEQHLPFLFDRFYRVSASRTRILNEHPSGLGLSVVKQLCLANNATVSASLRESSLVISIEAGLLEH